jgi:hypothetical protein
MPHPSRHNGNRPPMLTDPAAERRALDFAWAIYATGNGFRLARNGPAVQLLITERGGERVVATVPLAVALDAAQVLRAFDPEEYGVLTSRAILANENGTGDHQNTPERASTERGYSHGVAQSGGLTASEGLSPKRG